MFFICSNLTFHCLRSAAFQFGQLLQFCPTVGRCSRRRTGWIQRSQGIYEWWRRHFSQCLCSREQFSRQVESRQDNLHRRSAALLHGRAVVQPTRLVEPFGHGFRPAVQCDEWRVGGGSSFQCLAWIFPPFQNLWNCCTLLARVHIIWVCFSHQSSGWIKIFLDFFQKS